MTNRPVITALGLSISPPPGWEAAIYRRTPAEGERTFPIVHAATVPLPSHRADYGGGVVETLGPHDVFVAFLEFGPDGVEEKLFNGIRGVPGLTPDVFKPRQLQRSMPGQAGVQRFFTVAGRTFCLYSVLGALANRISLTARANQVIASFRVQRA